MTEFHTSINPALLLAIYTCKQGNCQTFSLNAGIPISEVTMVSTILKATINCGGMELAWCEWRRPPTIDQTWNNWKTHWTAAFIESCNINQMTAGNRAFANQAITNNEQTARMVTSLDNLANAAIQKNDTVNKLVAANECLTKALADANAAIACLCFPTTQLHQPLQPLQPAPTTVPPQNIGHPSKPNGIVPAIAEPTGTK